MIGNVNKLAVSHMIITRRVTLKVNICSVHVPLPPIRWRHWKIIQSALLLCCVILDKHGPVTWPSVIVRGSTVTNSAAGDYVGVPER